MPYRAMEIFRAGTHVASDGKPYSFSHEDLRAAAVAYNMAADVPPAGLFLGHNPKSERMGAVAGLHFSESGSVFALSHVTPKLLFMVRDGAYRHVSAAWRQKDARSNPRPGIFFLDHVAILGAAPPAVKGLQPLNFSEFAEFSAFGRKVEVSEPRLAPLNFREQQLATWRASDGFDGALYSLVNLGMPPHEQRLWAQRMCDMRAARP